MGLWEGATFGDAVTLAQYRQAMKGDTNAMREIRESIEGKARLAPLDARGPTDIQVHFVQKPTAAERAAQEKDRVERQAQEDTCVESQR